MEIFHESAPGCPFAAATCQSLSLQQLRSSLSRLDGSTSLCYKKHYRCAWAQACHSVFTKCYAVKELGKRCLKFGCSICVGWSNALDNGKTLKSGTDECDDTGRDTLTFQDYHGQELRLIEHFQRPFVGSLNSMTLTLDSTRARYHIRSSTAPHHTTCFALNIASSGHWCASDSITHWNSGTIF